MLYMLRIPAQLTEGVRPLLSTSKGKRMSLWPNSRMSSVYFSEESASIDYPCLVRIEAGKILVEYKDEGIVQYIGEELEEGHFKLACPQISGRASLHRFKDSQKLEGSWIEGTYRGMWLIELA